MFEEKLSNFKPKYFYVLSIIKDQLKLRRIKVVKENFFGESQSKLINHGFRLDLIFSLNLDQAARVISEIPFYYYLIVVFLI